MVYLHKQDVVTCKDMKLLEEMADQAGLSYYQMMENAGCRAAELIMEHYESGFGPLKKALVLCGKGNNGGDGFVVARKFYEAGISVAALLVEGEPVTEDAITNYHRIKDLIPIYTVEDSYLSGEEEVIVDAIYGTGFHGSLREHAEGVILCCNEAAIYTASLDLPSGLSGDMSLCEQMRPCIRASLTIPFHSKKPVHLNEHAKLMMGKIVVADIGIGEILEKGSKQ